MRLRRSKPAPSSETRSSSPSSFHIRRTRMCSRSGVADGVRERLLGDPVGDELELVAELVEAAGRLLALEGGADLGLAVDLLDEPGQGGLQPEVVERGRSQCARQRQQLLHRLGGNRAGLGELLGELGRRLRPQRLDPQDEGRQRLVDLVVEIACDACPLTLLGLERGAGAVAGARPRAGRASRGRRARGAAPPRVRRSAGPPQLAAGRGRRAPSRRRDARAGRSGVPSR